jgi:hypothetical protein
MLQVTTDLTEIRWLRVVRRVLALRQRLADAMPVTAKAWTMTTAASLRKSGAMDHVEVTEDKDGENSQSENNTEYEETSLEKYQHLIVLSLFRVS